MESVIEREWLTLQSVDNEFNQYFLSFRDLLGANSFTRSLACLLAFSLGRFIHQFGVLFFHRIIVDFILYSLLTE